MRKSISVLLLLAFSFAVVSAHSNPVRVDDDAGLSKIHKADGGSSFDLKKVDLVFINDATVPEVQTCHVNHIASILSVAKGHPLRTPAMIRGPTTDKTDLSPRSRDKPVRV